MKTKKAYEAGTKISLHENYNPVVKVYKSNV